MPDLEPRRRQAAMAYLLVIAGLGGLLYGIDVGIIAGALPYLETTAAVAWRLSTQQLGFVVAAVLLGSVLSSLLAGALADAIGRRPAMVLAGLLFSVSIPVIGLADGYASLLLGRLLQGVSGGLIGVVVPLYLAECLGARQRGRGAALFQLLLTMGLVAAAVIGLAQASQVDAVTRDAQALAPAARAAAVLAARDHAWRMIFWLCLAPGVVFTLGSLRLSESPRWLVRRGRTAQAHLALLRTRAPEAAAEEMTAMQQAHAEHAGAAHDSLLQARYLKPFLLACLILALTQATGINSILAYVVTILHQAGLPGALANQADVGLKVLNALMTVVAVVLVDRKGRRFLLMTGCAAIALALLATGFLFAQSEAQRIDVRSSFQQMVRGDGLRFKLDDGLLRALGAADGGPQQLTLTYGYGPLTDVISMRSDDAAVRTIDLRRADQVHADSLPGSWMRALHLNPFPDPAAVAAAPLRIEQAWLAPVPPPAHGWQVALAICVFVAGFAVGPGVCVWLALSELMPTRIRSNGMSIALLINQAVSTTIAAAFLPAVGRHGYSTVFLAGAAAAVVYLGCVAWLLPETKGRTLEEIESHFKRA